MTAYECLESLGATPDILRDVRKAALTYRRLMTQGRGLSGAECEKRDGLRERLDGLCSAKCLTISDIADMGWPRRNHDVTTCWIDADGGRLALDRPLR